MTFTPDELSHWIHTACLLEATARKPGNVHPGASFADLTYGDFVRAAGLTSPILARAATLGVGRTILDAVRATAAAGLGNVNLGIVLLIAPLAAVPPGQALRDGVGDVLSGLTRNDAALAYEAIRLAAPGGLGTTAEADVAEIPSVTLLEAMELAAQRDAVAAEYANGFRVVLETGPKLLGDAESFARDWETAVVGLHLRLMANLPDTLIARKCGGDVAAESAERARGVLEAGWPQRPEGRRRFERLDAWLRADGNRRNPGTTADLVAAVLFACLREGRIEVPAHVLQSLSALQECTR